MSEMQVFPPGGQGRFMDEQAPDICDGSFLVDPELGLIELPSTEEIECFDHEQRLQHPAYARYIRIHKVLVGSRGAGQLVAVYEGLKHERMPEYLIPAASALAEAALRGQGPTEERLALLDEAVVTWRRALAIQQHLVRTAPEDKFQHDTAPRIELDIATAPLLACLIKGEVTKEVCDQVFLDCLNIAEFNNVQIHLAKQIGDDRAVNDRTGFAYECNAMLAINRYRSTTWFALPATARCDSGYYYRDQTHDLLVLRLKRGEIVNGTPVEVKGKPTRQQRERYHALLVRGKMHLSVNGKATPDHTLNAIGAVYRGDASSEESGIAQAATHNFIRMLQDYFAGSVLGDIAGRNTVTLFHDKSIVQSKHPGLTTSVA